MSLPKAVFLDTCIFTGQGYNFASTAISSFLPVAKERKLKLLLPDPTEREILRQIRQRSDEALAALEEARRKAPFLSKWKHFPPKSGSYFSWEVGGIAEAEWKAFQKSFVVEKLGYKGVSIETVMAWYDQAIAPFGEGKKRKEFPDAFAIAILANWAEQNDCGIAIVSEDSDMRKACDRFTGLLYFPSLPRLTELLLMPEAEMLSLREAVEAYKDTLGQAIDEDIRAGASYYTLSPRYHLLESAPFPVEIEELRIVSFGHNECTVVFQGNFDTEHHLGWQEIVDYEEGYTENYEEYGTQSNSLYGTVKLALDSKEKSVTSILSLEISGLEIEVTARPRHY